MLIETRRSKPRKHTSTPNPNGVETNGNLNGSHPRQGRTKRKLLVVGGAALGMGYGVWQAGRTRFNPKINGTLNLAGLKASVEVIRDKSGVAHLYATSLEDLMLAQGFVHAQDRFWQMEFQRRLATGRLSEILGEPALPADLVMRRFNLRLVAEQNYDGMSGEERGLLSCYSAGVNAFIKEKKLPLEFSILRHKPEDWKPLDSLIWSSVMAVGQSGNFEAELLRAKLVQKVGPEKAARLEPMETADLPQVMPVGTDYAGIDFEAMLAQFTSLHELGGLIGAGNGSNNWVVDGTKSVTGKPLLANDPHIATSMPGVWYEIDLHAPDFEVAGVSMPGVPMVVLGHNRHIAWGVTNTMADIQDGFIEKIDPANRRRYEYKGVWREFESRQEEIKVKGSKPTMYKEFFHSAHGPIMSDFNPNLPQNEEGNTSGIEKPIAVCWTLYETSRAFRALMGLNRARNWEEFRAALRDWDIPSMNFVYADTEGNIGFQYAGRIPIRVKGQGRLPSPGHTGEYDWQGYIPFEELPHLYNPASHLIFTTNNPVTDNTYPYHLSSEYIGSWRAKRIRTLLNAKEKLSLEDFRQIQTDLYTEPGHIFAHLMLNLEPKDAWQRQALSYFRTWDGQLTATSVAGSLYKMTIYKLLRQLFIPLLGEPLADRYMGVGEGLAPLNVFSGQPGPMVIRLIEKNDTWLLPEGQTWPQAMQIALEAAIAELRPRLGEDMSGWVWGKLHTMKYNHTLGAVKPLDRVFNRGPQPIGGDTDTVWQTGYSGKEADFTANGATSSFRGLFDLSNLDRSLIGIVGGQSGSPFSPHYFDLAEEWIAGELHPLISNRSELRANTEGTLTLKPI
ncbi:MAG: penicillin acylase family protein [Chloroflexota bacterium]